MDFNFSEEQRQLQDTIERFVRNDYGFEKRRAIAASAEGFSRQAWQGLADLGVLAINVPEEHGGLGFGPVETMLAMQASAPSLPCEPLLSSAVIATALVRDFGDDGAQAELLPALASGERIVVLAHHEAPGRGMPGWVQTRVAAEGDGYVIDGRRAAEVELRGCFVPAQAVLGAPDSRADTSSSSAAPASFTTALRPSIT